MHTPDSALDLYQRMQRCDMRAVMHQLRQQCPQYSNCDLEQAMTGLLQWLAATLVVSPAEKYRFIMLSGLVDEAFCAFATWGKLYPPVRAECAGYITVGTVPVIKREITHLERRGALDFTLTFLRAQYGTQLCQALLAWELGVQNEHFGSKDIMRVWDVDVERLIFHHFAAELFPPEQSAA